MHDAEQRFRDLVESEERLRAFMRHSPVLAFMKDADGRYVYINPRMEETFGIRLSDIIGKADFDWLPAPVARTVRQNDETVLAKGEVLELVETIPMPDGTVHHWMVLKFPFTQADGQKFVGGVAMDITSRMEVEDALQRKEEEVRTLLDNTPDIVARFDNELRHVFVNRAAELLRGVPANDLLGKTLAEVGVPKDQRALLESQIRHVFSSGQETSFEAMSADPNAVTYHQVRLTPERDEGGVIRTVLVGSRDITKLKRTEKRLIESERRYRHLFESALGLMCTHDLDGIILSVNAAAAESIGYEASELIGTNLHDHLAPDVRKHFGRYLERVKQNATDDGLMLVLAKDGQVRAWKYRNALISEFGTPDYVLGHAQDVTELKQAQEKARSLSLTDDLTGLYNRRGFFALAEQHLKLARAPRTKRGTLLVYADVDELKQINDRFGHDQGSLAIVKVAELLRQTFRESDILARLGGDEFVALTISATDDDEPAIRARLDQRLNEYNARGHHPFTLSLSVGTAPVDSGRPRSIEELLKAADDAMYQEKRRKKEQRDN